MAKSPDLQEVLFKHFQDGAEEFVGGTPLNLGEAECAGGNPVSGRLK